MSLKLSGKAQSLPFWWMLILARLPACLAACRITLELRDRQTKVDVLHSKFEMLASRAHGTDADRGEPKSQAYYIVKVRRQGGGHLLPVAWCLQLAEPTTGVAVLFAQERPVLWCTRRGCHRWPCLVCVVMCAGGSGA